MAATKTRQGIQQPQPDEQEYRAIQQFIENWYLPPRSHHASLHIYEDCSQFQSQGGEVSEKPPAVYPYGYSDVCQYCLEEYRS